MIKNKGFLDDKRKGFFRENYRESLDYIKDSRNFIYSIMAIFLSFSFIGFFVPAPSVLETKILEFIAELLRETGGLSQLELIKFIFFNNIQSSFIGMLFGIILGIFPVIAALANGYLLGFVAEKTAETGGIYILWRIFPHGIFELPALFISLGLGLKLGIIALIFFIVKPIQFYWNKNKLISFSFILFYLPTLIITLISNNKLRNLMEKLLFNYLDYLSKSIKVFFFIVIPSLIIAAVIEGSLIFLF